MVIIMSIINSNETNEVKEVKTLLDLKNDVLVNLEVQKLALLDGNMIAFNKASVLSNESLKAYNDLKRQEEYTALLSEVLPIKAAIIKGSINIGKIKLNTENNTYSIEESMEIIDLYNLELLSWEKAKKSLFRDINVISYIDNLNHVLFKNVIKDLEIKPENVNKRYDSYKTIVFESSLNIKDSSTVTAQTKIIKYIFDSMVYNGVLDEKEVEVNEWKVTSRDTKALTKCYAKWSKQKIGGIVFTTDKAFRELVVRVFNRILTNGEFSAEQNYKLCIVHSLVDYGLYRIYNKKGVIIVTDTINNESNIIAFDKNINAVMEILNGYNNEINNPISILNLNNGMETKTKLEFEIVTMEYFRNQNYVKIVVDDCNIDFSHREWFVKLIPYVNKMSITALNDDDGSVEVMFAIKK